MTTQGEYRFNIYGPVEPKPATLDNYYIRLAYRVNLKDIIEQVSEVMAANNWQPIPAQTAIVVTIRLNEPDRLRVLGICNTVADACHNLVWERRNAPWTPVIDPALDGVIKVTVEAKCRKTT